MFKFLTNIKFQKKMFSSNQLIPVCFQALAFSVQERQLLGIHGLLPAVVKTLEEQVKHATLLLDRCATDLDRYIYLMGLQDRNEHLFYKVLSSDISRMMPLVYSE